eukprot:6176264-Pleurochrysis_carterae.AAC.2
MPGDGGFGMGVDYGWIHGGYRGFSLHASLRWPSAVSVNIVCMDVDIEVRDYMLQAGNATTTHLKHMRNAWLHQVCPLTADASAHRVASHLTRFDGRAALCKCSRRAAKSRRGGRCRSSFGQ